MRSPAKEWIGLELVVRSMISKRKRVDASTEPWGTLAFIENGWVGTPSTRMEMVCLLRKLDAHGMKGGVHPNMGGFDRRPSRQTRSKTLGMPSKTRCFSMVVEWSRPGVRRQPVERGDRKPYWQSLGSFSQLTGDDSFKYFRNDRGGRNRTIVVRINSITVLREDGMFPRGWEGRKF